VVVNVLYRSGLVSRVSHAVDQCVVEGRSAVPCWTAQPFAIVVFSGSTGYRYRVIHSQRYELEFRIGTVSVVLYSSTCRHCCDVCDPWRVLPFRNSLTVVSVVSSVDVAFAGLDC